MFAVPLKSLKRWIKVGPERKKGKVIFSIIFHILGGGRKIRDPEMEKTLFNWYEDLKKKKCSSNSKNDKKKSFRNY